MKRFIYHIHEEFSLIPLKMSQFSTIPSETILTPSTLLAAEMFQLALGKIPAFIIDLKVCKSKRVVYLERKPFLNSWTTYYWVILGIIYLLFDILMTLLFAKKIIYSSTTNLKITEMVFLGLSVLWNTFVFSSAFEIYLFPELIYVANVLYTNKLKIGKLIA